MPLRKTSIKLGTRQVLKNTAYELEVAAWLMHDGWETYQPFLDNGHCTDLLISDGPNYYRLQIKTVAADNESHKLKNAWKDSRVDWVIAFARNSNWGYIMPAFSVGERRLNFESHQRFKQTKKDFLKAFHQLKK
jgi:hypothetical protein